MALLTCAYGMRIPHRRKGPKRRGGGGSRMAHYARQLQLPCDSTFMVYMKQGIETSDKAVVTYDALDPQLADALKC
eukprot:364503-Chlamydomonas_euryale.AAC.3